MTTNHEKRVPYEEGGDLHLFIGVISIIVSVALHIILVFFAGDSKINFVRALTATLEQKLALRNDSAMHLETVQADPEIPLEKTAEPETDPYDVKIEEIFLSVPTATQGAAFEPPPAASDLNSGLVPEIQMPVIAEKVEPITPWQPREEVLTISEKIVYENIVPFQRRDVPDIERRLFTPDVSLQYELKTALETANRVGTPAYVNPAPPKVDDATVAETLEGGERRMPESIQAGTVASGEAATEFLKEIPSEVAPAKPIENVLQATVSLYRPRRSDGYAYFRIDVERKAADVLPAIPRDILLVQDASASLSPERLHFCRQAFAAVVDGLKPTDRFNVVKFNTLNTFCFGTTWRSPDDAARNEAKAFINAIQSEGNTDIFNAVNAVLEMPRDQNRVMVVILASDGRTTAGETRRDSEIIGKFSKLNDGKVSVFNVGVSKSSNEFLLSMLSFCNRGGAASIADDRFDIVKTVDRLYGTVGNPVLSNISFIFDSASRAEVAPAMTTHLYLDRPMQLFGRVPENTKQVIFQARGTAIGKKYDMVFDLDLDNASVADKKLAKEWATARMYDYVAEFARKPHPMLLADMNELGRAYDVTIPFKDRLF